MTVSPLLGKLVVPWCWVALSLCALPGFGQHALPAADQAALRMALDAYDRGDFATAEPMLKALAKRSPHSYEVNEALGSLLVEQDHVAEALPYLRRACLSSPREPIAHANLGAALLKAGTPEQAVAELEEAAKLDPASGATLVNLGQTLMVLKRPVPAAKAYAAASRLSPGEVDLKYNQALALYDSGAFKEAAAVLDGIEPAQRTAEMHALGGDADEKAGAFPQALSHYEAAERMTPSEGNLYAVAVELMRHWNWDEAIKVARYGVTTYPDSVRFKLAEGIAYYGKSDYAPAVQMFSAQLQADPNNAAIADLLGRSCAALQDGENTGCDAVYGFAQRHPGNAVMTMYAAVAILHEPAAKQDLNRAATMLQASIAADPKYAEAYLQLGVLEQMRQHWAESAALLEKSIALNPTAPEAHYRLSRAYSHLGRKDEAQQQIVLHQTLADEAKHKLDARLQDVMRFVLTPAS